MADAFIFLDLFPVFGDMGVPRSKPRMPGRQRLWQALGAPIGCAREVHQAA
jgi:hypothetical protein